MSYHITFKKAFIKTLTNIDEPYYSKIREATYALADNPRPPGCKKLKGREEYRIRIGNYRVLYQILDTELIVIIIEMGHRKDVYDNF